MRGHSVNASIVLMLLMSTAALAQTDSSSGPVVPRVGHVSYLTSATVYLDVGSADGLAVGMLVDAIRDGRVIGKLQISFLSEHRASCTRISGEPIQLEDSVRFVPTVGSALNPPSPPSGSTPGTPFDRSGPAPTAPAATTAAAGPPTAPAKRRQDSVLHGRIGVRWLSVRTSGEGADLSQPAIDLRLDGRDLFGAPLTLSIDARARFNQVHATAGGRQSTTRVYRAALGWQPAADWSLTVGRQFLPAMSSIQLFDGLSAEYHQARWRAGLFGGSLPREGDLGYSSAQRAEGTYFELHHRPGSAHYWSTSVGYVTSTDHGEINRDFGFWQAQIVLPQFSAYALQEIDLYRGWRRQREGKSMQATASLISLQWRPIERLSLDGGWDNRRNVLTFRDRDTPETEFDDAIRQGAWLGTSVQAWSHLRFGLQGRRSSGGSLQQATSVTFNTSATDLFRLHADLRWRSTHFDTDRETGWLHSLHYDMPLGERWRLGAEIGHRSSTPQGLFVTATSSSWVGLDADWLLNRHWFASASLEHSTGSGEDPAVDQLFLTLAYRF